MFYITGDPHRNFGYIEDFLREEKTTKDDIMIVLGDVGVNFYLNVSDRREKRRLEELPITFLFLRGNHEERPENIPSYHRTHINDKFEADCFVEDDFPSLYFLDNGTLILRGEKNEKKVLVINGAYSVDKMMRIVYGWPWFKDEELTDDEMNEIYEHAPSEVDYIFSHTCPLKYEPIEAYLPGLDASSISKRMEEFLDKIEDHISYSRWYCGHWHINKDTHRLHFLFHDIMSLPIDDDMIQRWHFE